MINTKKVTVFKSPKTEDHVFCVAFTNAEELDIAMIVIQHLFGYSGPRRNLPISELLGFGWSCEKGFVAIKRVRSVPVVDAEMIRIYQDVGLSMRETLANWVPEDYEEKEALVNVSGPLGYYSSRDRSFKTKNATGDTIDVKCLELHKLFIRHPAVSEKAGDGIAMSVAEKRREQTLDKVLSMFFPLSSPEEDRLSALKIWKERLTAEEKFPSNPTNLFTNQKLIQPTDPDGLDGFLVMENPDDKVTEADIKKLIALIKSSNDDALAMYPEKMSPFLDTYAEHFLGLETIEKFRDDEKLLKGTWTLSDILKNILKNFFPTGEFYPLERGIVVVARKLRHQQVVDFLEHASERKDIFPEKLIQHHKNNPLVANVAGQREGMIYDMYCVMNAGYEKYISLILLPEDNYRSDKNAIGNCCPETIFDESGMLIEPVDSKG